MIHLNTKKIIIPIDFSDTSLLAIKHGAFLAQYTKGEVLLVHIIARHWEQYNVFGPIITMENIDSASTEVESKLQEIAADIRKEYGVEVSCIVTNGNIAKELVNIADESEAGLIIMGTHGYSAWEELVIGSNALKVITKATCPVMTMSHHAEKLGYNKLLIPIDTSEHSRQKVVYALELARLFSAHVYAVGVLAHDEENERGAMEVMLNQVENAAKERHVICTTELVGGVKNRAIATVKYGEKVGADLIVIMTDQDAELSGFFLGPYSQQVIHHAKVPVISVKPEDHPEDTNWSILAGTSGF